jgi:hypothetical protein
VPKTDGDTEAFYEECSLSCLNGGKCRKGAKNDLSLNGGEQQGGGPSQSVFNQDFEHCVCPEGFTGLSCEYKYEECGNGDHYCLHGSRCVPNDKNVDGWSCDCQSATSSSSSSEGSLFAGDHCQHHATTVCTRQDNGDGSAMYDPATSMVFCVNDGICTEIEENGETRPGCKCPPGYVGDHCELLESARTNRGSNSDGAGGDSAAILFVCFVLGILLVFIVVIIILRLRGLRLQKQRTIDGRVAKLHCHESSSGASSAMEEVNFEDEFEDEDLEDVELL